jgi:signal transduction histidine kinase
MFDLWHAITWAATTAKAFAEVAALMGVGLAVLAGAIAAGVLFAPTRRLAIELAIVCAVAIALYGRGVHDGDVAIRQLWAAANAAAALERMEQQRAAEAARDDSVNSGLTELAAENQTLAEKVKAYEERERIARGGAVCLVGSRAGGLRDIAGEPAGATAPANKRSVVRPPWRKGSRPGNKPGT